MIQGILNWFKRFFTERTSKLSIGFYGSPNAGKTSLANKICKDLGKDPMGKVSMVPHETRTVGKTESLIVKLKNATLTMNILDMPGVAVKVDYREFLNYGITVEEAQLRAREATKGIIEALKELDGVDAALIVIDSTKDPITQTNITLLGNLEARGIPTILVANKIDLENSNVKKVIKSFPDYPIVPLSALTGKNLNQLYETISVEMSNR